MLTLGCVLAKIRGSWRDRVVAKAHTSFYHGVGFFVFGLVHSYAEGLGVKAAR